MINTQEHCLYFPNRRRGRPMVVGVLGALHRVTVMAEWRAMYPTNPREMAALQLCFAENHQFNRMSDKARKDCYGEWMPRLSDKLTVRL